MTTQINVVAPRDEQPVQVAQWPGHASQKFTTWKEHTAAPIVDQGASHPLFSMGGMRHYDAKLDKQAAFKPSCRVGIEPAHKDPRIESVKMLNFKPIPAKNRAERSHMDDRHQSMKGPTFDNTGQSLLPFEQANKQSSGEYSQEKVMTQKGRIKSLYDQRNQMPMASLGDKIYKNPDYDSGFFKDGGLITGSTQQLRMKSSGNGKAIDFYSGLKLDQGPLNPNRKTWAQAVKDQQLNEELDAVNGLKDWERGTLKEVDPNFEVDDDSDVEKPPVEEVTPADDTSPGKKGKK